MSEKANNGPALLREWKDRLGLQDWTIKLNCNCTPEQMSMAESAGCTTYTETIKCARIDIVDPKYYGNRIRPFNFEKTLVHELLHLKLCLIGDSSDTLQERLVHQYIDDLARALVDAKRSGAESVQRKRGEKT